MTEDYYTNRPLFGGAISSTFPHRFQDVSNVRQVPDHQEAYVDPGRDESLIFELLDLKHDIADNGSATWFFQDLASEQDAEGSTLIEQSGIIEAEWLQFRNMPTVITTAVGQMAISKGRQGREAQNIVKVYLANLRLKEVGTDILITAYEPLLINSSARSPGRSSVRSLESSSAISREGPRSDSWKAPRLYPREGPRVKDPSHLSESASVVGAGLAVPAEQSGFVPVAEVFKHAVSSFKVNDWSLFGGPA